MIEAIELERAEEAASLMKSISAVAWPERGHRPLSFLQGVAQTHIRGSGDVAVVRKLYYG